MPEQPEKQLQRSAFWSGTITFGLVSIPVALFSGIRPRRISLRMLAPDGTPLRRRYFCPEEDRMLEKEEIVRGYEVEENTYVTVSNEELAGLSPKKSKEIDLRLFVPVEQIDPAFFDRTYILTPGAEIRKPYRLIAEAMEKSGRAGIATFVMRGKEHLVAILSENGILRAQTLRFADEIRSVEDIGLPERQQVPQEAVEEITAQIRAASAPELKVDLLADRYADNLVQLVEKKLEAGQDVLQAAEDIEPDEEEQEETAQLIDLMEVLKRNLGALPQERKPPGKQKKRKR